MRGVERRKAQLVSFRFRHRLRHDGIPEAHRLSALHCGTLGEGTVLPGGDGGATRPLIRPAFAAFIRTASSRERQSHVVGPDGDPSLPGSCLRDTRAGAASCSAFKTPLESAPHEQDVTNISAVRRAGMCIPITKCFGGYPALMRATLALIHQRKMETHSAHPPLRRRFTPIDNICGKRTNREHSTRATSTDPSGSRPTTKEPSCSSRER